MTHPRLQYDFAMMSRRIARDIRREKMERLRDEAKAYAAAGMPEKAREAMEEYDRYDLAWMKDGEAREGGEDM